MLRTREILRQKWFLGRSHREVGRSLDLSVGMVSATLRRTEAAGVTSWQAASASSDRELESLHSALSGARPQPSRSRCPRG